MKEQAGETRKELQTVEELLQQAGGWSKFDPFANDIERLVAGGVRQRVIADWLAAHEVKVASGEISHWLKRRREQRGRQQQVTAAAPLTLTPTTTIAHPADALPGQVAALLAPKTSTTPPVDEPITGKALRSPDERSGSSSAERDLDAQVEAALELARQTKGRRGLRSADKPAE